jgi:hypothetical protein
MPLTQGIGVISTITFTGTSLEDNFKRGVRDGNSPKTSVYYAPPGGPPPLEDLGYVDKALNDAVDRLNKDGNVGVIVTVGGLAPATAAKNKAQKPFLSVFGGTTSKFDGIVKDPFWGGIDLDTPQGNSARLDALWKNHGIQRQKVCLLSNPVPVDIRSAEVAAWTGGRIIDANDPSTFANAFSTFNGDANLLAMIVGGSPIFQDHKDELIAEANKYNKHVCYPFHIYANEGKSASKKPKPGRDTLHGPKLGTAYYDLGVKVGNVLASDPPRPSTVTKADIGDPVNPVS